MTDLPNLARRGFLLGGAALGAGALVACTSNQQPQSAPQGNVVPQGENSQPGKMVTIGFSAPAADHGWIAAITKNAKAQADKFKADVTLKATEGTNDPSQQIAQVETLINSKVDVLVILPMDGKQLTSVGQSAMDKGIPVVNLDRIFDTALAYRTWVGGDNYRMGVNAGAYIAAEMKKKNISNPIIGEVAGIDSLPLTQDRSKGFRDALAKAGFKVGPRVAAEFTVETGERQTANLLSSAPKLDALWNHDDDQGIGVMAAISAANRKEFIMVGGAGSRNMIDKIKADTDVIKATVLYSPSMASTAISLARLIGQAKGLGDLAEHEVPASITTYSAVVTKENAANYADVAFDS